MKSEIYINHLDYYIPEGKLNVNDIKEESIIAYFKTKDEFLKSCNDYLNLESVRVDPDKSMQDMVLGLLDNALDNGVIDPESIDYLILAPIYNADLEGFGHFLFYEFDMNNSEIFRVGEHYCANIDLSLGFIQKLISSADKKNALVVTGSKLDRESGRIIGTYAVAGDSASYMLVSNKMDENTSYEFIGQSTVIKGELNNVDLAANNTILHYQAYLECFRKLIADNNIDVDKVEKIICHNANIALVTEVLKSLKFNLDNVFTENHGKYGHLGTTDLILNLDTCKDELKFGDLVISISLGVIGTYAATVYKKK